MPDIFNGEIYRQVGKYARGAVLYAFEQSGGPDALSDWAVANPDEFYTKLFPKIIARESEVQHVRGVDDLMDLLDGEYEIMDEAGGVMDAEVVDEPPVMDRVGDGWGADPMTEITAQAVAIDPDVATMMEFEIEFDDDE